MRPVDLFRIQKLPLASIFIAFSMVGLANPANSQQPPNPSSPTYHSIREALLVLKTTRDKDEQKRIYQHFQQIPVRDHDDLIALYDEAKHRQDAAPLITTSKSFDEYVNEGQIVSVRLKGVTDPAFHDDIAALLDEETRDLPRNSNIPLMPIGNIELGAGAKSAVRLARIHSLIDAAGDGKNEKARAALWRMVDQVQDSYFGQLAIAALGKIGNPEDLDRLIQMLENAPKLRLAFNEFGSMAIPRLMQETKNPALSAAKQGRFALGLIEVAKHNDIPTFVPMLHDPNKYVARAALDAIGKNLTSSDDDLIKKMLKDPSLEIQMKALNVIDGSAWDEKFIPVLIDEMRNGNDAAVRCLGHHKVKSAIPAIREAAAESPNRYVREAARYVLTNMSEH
jgi:HEAT repeat protein